MRKSMKLNKRFWVLVVAFTLLISGIGLISYYIINESTNLFKVMINRTFNALEDNVIDSDSIQNNLTLKVSGSSGDSATNNIIEMFSKIDLNLIYGVNYKDKIINTKLNSKYNGDELLNGNIYAEDGKVYGNIDDVYDKYIMFDVEDYDKLFSAGSNPDDMKIVMKKINKHLNESLKDEYFERGKKEGYKYIKLKLTEENYKEIREKLISAFKEDNVFLRGMAKITGDSESKIRSYLDNLLEQESIDDVDITIYTKGIVNSFKKIEIEEDDVVFSVTPADGKYEYSIADDSSIISDGEFSINKYKNGFKGEISVNDRNTNSQVKVVFNNKIRKNASIKKEDISNNIGYEDISSVDKMKIYTNIMKNKNIIEIVKQISLYSISTYRGSDSSFSIPDDNLAVVS